MRKKSTLSTIVFAAIIAVFSIQSTLAQTRALPDQKVDPQGFATPPRPLPSTTLQHQDGVIQRVGYQESDVEVPSILSGQKAASATRQESSSVAPATGMPPMIPVPDSTEQLSPARDQTTTSQMPPMRMANQPLRQLQPATHPAGSQLLPSQQPGAFSRAAQPPTTPPFTGSGIQQVSGQNSQNWLRTQEIENSENGSATKMPEANPTISTTAAEPINDTGLIETSGPKLRVSSIGPSSISIGKKARFEVLVENLESRSAQNIIVGIDLPEWVQVMSTVPSSGSRESTTGPDESRLIWQIPIVEAAATEKFVIEVIPQEARPFDMDVEWTFKPIRGKTTVEVTQPQLTIQIAGPTEVQFGEKALYDVTVSNPGTGTAENVNVMLPEVLGGERASLESIEPQQQKKFQVELIARSAGKLELTTTVLADGNLKESDSREIMVRRAVLNLKLDGPPMKYAGSMATYKVTVSNEGDAMAREVMAAVALPPGVDFVSGIDQVEKIEGGIRWNVGMLSPGNQRTYQLNCNMNVAGEIMVEAASIGGGDLGAKDKIVTRVDAVADLVLNVADPKGPLPTGQSIDYEIRIRNRGTKAARSVNVVMHFSEGVEPTDAEGIAHEIAPGQVTFAPIAQIDPGQEVVLKVMANASQSGSHRFRAQLLCEESDSHEVAEGTTRFFGDSIETGTERTGSSDLTGGEFKR